MIFSFSSIPGRLFIVCLFVVYDLFLFGCKKKEETEVYRIEVSPNNTELVSNEGDIVNLRIEFTSSKTISRIKISEKKQNVATKYVLDTIVSIKNSTLMWDYKFPAYQKSASNYYLDIDVIFSGGEVSTKRLSVIVLQKDVLLSELSGHTFYSKKSGKQDAYDLVNLRAVYAAFAKPEDVLSIVDTSNSNKLAKVWTSPANGYFVRHNTFDYANATLIKTRQAYESGLKQEIVSQVQEGDIIIYYQPAVDQFRVLKLTEVVDLDSTQYDKYVFSVKKP